MTFPGRMLLVSLFAFFTLTLAGRAYADQDVSIQLWEIDPNGFDKAGHAGVCNVKVVVVNSTKYHINAITYKIGDWNMSVPEMTANTVIRADFPITLDNDDESCTGQAEYLAANIAKAAVFDCTMPGLAEGDCQELVHITSAIDKNAINILRNNEIARIQRAAAQTARARSEMRDALEGATAPDESPPAAPAQNSPSFDCSTNLQPVEQAICGDADLSAKDRDMARLYFQIRSGLTGDDRQRFIQSQRDWLQARSNCADPGMRQCISDLLDKRISDLRTMAPN